MQPSQTDQTPVNRDFIRRAVDQASVNALRIALFHQTQDPELAAVTVEDYQLRGGALNIPVVPRDHHVSIRDKAVDYLEQLISGNAEVRANPDLSNTRRLLELYSGKPVTDSELHYAFEELAFEQPPRSTVWQNESAPNGLNDFHVSIVGSGVSGMAMAIQLARLGINYEIIERHPELGGTWYVNDYPEARVDVPTFGYQYKFEQDYEWQSFFAPRDELLHYANYIADKYRVRENIRFNTELVSAQWFENRKQWALSLRTTNSNGEVTEHQQWSNAVISASGLFSTPKLPDINGIETFQGALFHSTSWDHNFDLSNKRVALIGTGSTGTQLARGVAAKAAKLTVFQRTPNWVTPINGYHDKLSDELQWLLKNMPGYRSWFTYSNTASEFGAQDLHVIDPEFVAQGGRVNRKNQSLKESLTEFIKTKTAAKPELFEQLLPTHSPMARRLVIDNSWYDTLMRDNVSLISNGIREIRENSIVDDSGQEHPVDLIICSAGFEVSRYTWPVHYSGRGELSLQECWQADGARAFKGISVPEFPNFFIMYGPNAQLRAGTFHSVIEVLARYISGLLVYMIEKEYSQLEVKANAFEHYNQQLDEAMKSLLWNNESGEGSYYVNEHNRVGVLAPWRLHEFYDMVRKPDPENFDFS